MPNWCENSLVVTGVGAKQFLQDCYGHEPIYKDDEDHKLSLLQRANMEKKFTMNALHPVPQEILDTGYSRSSKEGVLDGYHWQIDNWGTKWDIEPDIHSEEEDHVSMSFESAWSPPIEWVNHVAELYPHLIFNLEFYEPGVGFAGRMVWTNGVGEEESYSYDEPGYKEFVAEELEYGWEEFGDDDDNDNEAVIEEVLE